MSWTARLLAACSAALSLALTPVAMAAESSRPEAASPEEPAIASLPKYLAEMTQRTAENLVAQFARIADAFGVADGEARPIDWGRLVELATELAIIVVATLVLFAVLRQATRPVIRWLGNWSTRDRSRTALFRRLAAMLVAVALGGAAIAVAWIAGHALALYLTGSTGDMSTSQSLFLNAFLGIELLKLVLRLAFSPDHAAVRLLPIGEGDAAYWNRRLSRLVTFAGYGLLFLVPVAEAQLAPIAGSAVSLIVLLLALTYTLLIIHQNRPKVRQKLASIAARTRFTPNRMLALALARTWHWIAIVYFVALAIAIQTRPQDLLPYMALATLQSLIAIGIGLVLYNFLSGLLGRRPRLPQALEQSLPQIGERVGFFIGPVLNVLRAVVAVAIVLALLDAWALFDLDGWLQSQSSAVVFASAASVAFIGMMAVVVWIAFATWVDRRVGTETMMGTASSRERTLLSLFRNAAAIVLIVMTTMIALSEIGIEIGPLLAGAGVLGLAIGFGAQSLVQDIITGVFIQLENAINRDDVVTVAGITGVVERLSIRSVALRDLSGTLHIVPFSNVATVSNYMRGYAYHLGDYRIAYREDPDEAIACLQTAFAELREDPEMGPAIRDELEIHGVADLGDSAVTVRVRIKTTPGMQWAVGRAYNRLVKRHLEAAGIEIPFPHTTLYFGQDKDGAAPPANLRWIKNSEQAGPSSGT